MSNGKNQVNTINWTTVFGFTHIFKSFRIAIHPSKLLLGLATVISIYLAGQMLDVVWNWCGQSVQDGDVVSYVCQSGPKYEAQLQANEDKKLTDARALKTKYRQERRELAKFTGTPSFGEDLRKALEERVVKYNETHKDDDDQGKITAQQGLDDKNDDWDDLIDDTEEEVERIREKIDVILDGAYEDAENALASETLDDKARTRRTEDLEKGYNEAVRTSVKITAAFNKEVSRIRGQQVFESFVEYEGQCLANALRAVRYGNFTTGLGNYEALMNQKSITPLADTSKPLAVGVKDSGSDDSAGFLFWTLMACQGLIWLICRHWFFATIFLTLSMSAWALFGGAMHRIAALHAAREEKISIVQALRFSASKFLSFFAAPLIPLIIILGLGLLLFLGGLLFGNLGGWLAWIMAILFPIAIIIGLLIAFLSVGLGGGCGLMYPTIAVEGSDAFDAISRSFSYVFARPWRTAIYGVVALIYGTLCYLFVRLFAFLALASTHWFVKGGVFSGGEKLAENADRMDQLWPAPEFSNFHPNISWEALNGMESIAAGIIAIWVYVVIAVVAAFGLSFLASSTTVVYYLLRRKVDATDLDDVYVEEVEEELAGEVAEALAEQTPETEEETTEEEAPAEEADEAEEESPAEEPAEEDEQADEEKSE